MKNENAVTAIVSILLGVVGLAIIAVLVSNHSNTGSVLGAGGSAIGCMICKAISPVTGNSCSGCGSQSSLTPVVTSTITF
jgi:hypothetical protein